jgi:membrane protease YdiL (CAAX protease family)
VAGALAERGLSLVRRWVVILVSMVVFTAVHFSFAEPNWEALPVLACLSVGLAYVYERTGNLWATMTLHCCFNGVNILLVYLGGEH